MLLFPCYNTFIYEIKFPQTSRNAWQFPNWHIQCPFDTCLFISHLIALCEGIQKCSHFPVSLWCVGAKKAENKKTKDVLELMTLILRTKVHQHREIIKAFFHFQSFCHIFLSLSFARQHWGGILQQKKCKI